MGCDAASICAVTNFDTSQVYSAVTCKLYHLLSLFLMGLYGHQLDSFICSHSINYSAIPFPSVSENDIHKNLNACFMMK